jgi:hypothetical protein
MRDSERLLAIRVRPRSSRAGVGLAADGLVVVHVHAPALGGAANQECTSVLAKALGLPRSAVQIVRGEKSRAKQVAIAGLTGAEARARLESGTGRGRGRP